jgi:P4 family phage/plasmid primase-like protien
VSYDPDNLGLPVKWLRYLRSAFPAADLQAVSDKLAVGIAYTLTECRPFLKKCFYLDGPSNSGKSVVLDLLSKMSGEAHASELGLKEINNQFGPARLIGKLVNTEAEVSNAEKFDSARFKAIVAGDAITGERKGQDSFRFKPTVVLWMGGNVLPQFTRGSSGIIERFCFIPYRNALKPSQRDKSLLRQLVKEMNDIFHWAIHVYRREYLKDRCESVLEAELTTSPAAELADESIPYQDWLYNWLDFTDNAADFATSLDLYDSYTDWHVDNPQAPYPTSRVSFGKKVGRWLREMPGHEVEHARKSVDGEQQWVWTGVRVIR